MIKGRLTSCGSPGSPADIAGVWSSSMVVPLYDDNPFSLPHRPLMTWGLIVGNIGLYGIELLSDNPAGLIRQFGLTPAALVGDGIVPGALPPALTLLTYQFFHADIVHV